jgi:hypothetical protein
MLVGGTTTAVGPAFAEFSELGSFAVPKSEITFSP